MKEVCGRLEISSATAGNWLRLGKLVPSGTVGTEPVFDADTIAALQSELESGKNPALKSRRNKAFVSGARLCRSYVAPDCPGLASVRETLRLLSDGPQEGGPERIRAVIADAALQMLTQQRSGERKHLPDFLKNPSAFSFAPLILDLAGGIRTAREQTARFPELFAVPYSFCAGEDVLGLLYLSCRDAGNRRRTGSYYTPAKIVQEMTARLPSESGLRILDPCCGTGNFLLQLPDSLPLEDLYGRDIDEISVQITRINLALRYRSDDLALLTRHFTVSDYLLPEEPGNFNVILGNPPWGIRQTAEDGTKEDSGDLFVEKALRDTAPGGRIFFVLPEALLSVASHRRVREQIARKASIEYLSYLGDRFDGVMCPCILLSLRVTGEPMNTRGMEVATKERTFRIRSERRPDPACFCYDVDDREYEVLHQIRTNVPVQYLKGQAVFALGIVTGRNRECLSSSPAGGGERILRGSDLLPYRFREPETYLRYEPGTYQQEAPSEYYRADEKLLYRFVSDRLIFSYDDRRTLSLNSANLLIPQVEGMSVRYVCAVLNSQAAQFYFRKTFRANKVLRSHLEQIPLPPAGEEERRGIEDLVDRIRASEKEEEILALREQIDQEIFRLYRLGETAQQIIRSAQQQGADRHRQRPGRGQQQRDHSVHIAAHGVQAVIEQITDQADGGDERNHGQQGSRRSPRKDPPAVQGAHLPPEKCGPGDDDQQLRGHLPAEKQGAAREQDPVAEDASDQNAAARDQNRLTGRGGAAGGHPHNGPQSEDKGGDQQPAAPEPLHRMGRMKSHQPPRQIKAAADQQQEIPAHHLPDLRI